jgi:hypothetical protein
MQKNLQSPEAGQAEITPPNQLLLLCLSSACCGCFAMVASFKAIWEFLPKICFQQSISP